MDLSQAAVGLVVTTLLILYAGSLIWGIIRRPSTSGFMSLAMMLGFMLIGWMLRGWPGRPKDANMFLTFLIAWKDSVLLLLATLLKLVGITEVVTEVWERWFAPFMKKGLP
jgi:hypothetical protein